METLSAMIEIQGLKTGFGQQIIHENLNLTVYQGEILGIVGGSGSGKSVLLNTIIGLNAPLAGTVQVKSDNWGVLYQKGALFSSLNVAQNIKVPMRELGDIPEKIANELVALKMQMVGLELDVANKFPSELSGGMVKRVALARALAMDAPLLLLDEPTAGLDPISASSFDKLCLELKKNLDLTIVMVTHDLHSLFALSDRIAVLIDKKIIVGTKQEILNNPHPWIQAYFTSARGANIPK